MPLIKFSYRIKRNCRILIVSIIPKTKNMRRKSTFFFLLSAGLCWTLGSTAQTKPPAAGADTAKKTPKVTIAEKVKSSRKIEGLLIVYQDTATGSVQLYIKKDQLGKEFI